MANGACDSYCKGCIYSNYTSGEYSRCCTYYLVTDKRRPCPAGTGCAVKETGKKKGAWQHQNDAEWAKKMQEARKARQVVRKGICKECGTEFETAVTHQIYCSKRCNNRVSQRNAHRRKLDEKQAKSAAGEV